MNYPGRIYLVGYMGSGKSTTGKRLASKLNYRFVDLDRLIESTYKTSIPLLFEKYDEHAFRLLEQSALKNTLTGTRTVIATGGGAPCFFDNMDVMNRNGFTIYLKMTPGALAYRLKHARKRRPLLENINEAELQEHISHNLEEREKYYKKAQLIVDAHDDVSEKILAALAPL